MPSFLERIKARKFASAASTAVDIGVDGDAQSRLAVDAGGKLTWGDGGTAGDTNLYRDAANVLKTDDTLKVPSLFVDGIEIDTTGAASQDVLIFNGTKFAAASASFGGGGATTLDGLTDVVITSPTNYQVLEYDGTAWVNVDASVTTYVRNAEATTLNIGEVVYLYQQQGNRASVKRAINTSDATSAKTLGVVAASIPASSDGPVVTQGYVYNCNLGSFTAGQTVYLSSTAGQFTATKPYAPNHLVYVGVVVRANNGNGILYVRAQNGYELDEIHDVDLITNPPTSGQFLKYNGTLWVNDTIDLGTDTNGNYMSGVSAGTGISVTHTPGEGSTATIAVDNTVVKTTDTGTVTSAMIANGTIVDADINSTAAISLSKLSTTGATTNDVIKFNGSVWTAASAAAGGASVTISDTAPASPSAGNLWFESDTGRTFIYYDSYWTEVGAVSTGEVNSYNMDGGQANSVYGGIAALTGGSA